MNRKAAIFTSYFMAPLFIILYLYAWIFIFGPVLAQFGTTYAINAGLTGFEGLVWRTINIWAGLIPLILYIMAVGAYGGQQ